MKVDQFRTYLLNRDFPDRQMLKLVGSDALEAFGRQLVKLHSPARFDGGARFGLAVTPPPVTASAAPARKPWLVKFDGPCSNCGKVLVKDTPAVWRQAQRRLLCLECGAA